MNFTSLSDIPTFFEQNFGFQLYICSMAATDKAAAEQKNTKVVGKSVIVNDQLMHQTQSHNATR